jgi:hypothetical protein
MRTSQSGARKPRKPLPNPEAHWSRLAVPGVDGAASAKAEPRSGTVVSVTRYPVTNADSAMLKLWLLFVLDLAAIVCALRAAPLMFAAQPLNATPTWDASEAAGFMCVGCICAFAAFLVAVLIS